MLKNTNVLDLANLNQENILLLNRISIDLIEDFNRLSDTIFQLTNKKRIWLFTSVLSRNPYQSNLFLYCCFLILIENILSDDQNINTIIVPSSGFKKVLLRYIRLQSLKNEVKVFSNKVLKRKLKDLIWKYFGIFINSYYCWKLYSTGDRQRKQKICATQKVKLIDTFILQNSIQKKIYLDRYYNDIVSYIEEKTNDVLFFVPHILGKYKKVDLHKIYVSSKENIIFKQDFLKLIDYIFALVDIFKVKKIRNQSVLIREFDVYPIICEEILIKKYTALNGILNFLFFKRLKEANVDLEMVVDWFENQQIDKGFNLGVHTFYPKIKHIGYKGYIISEDYNFYINPTRFEVEQKLIPKTIYVIGKGLEENSKNFYKKQKVQLAPAFRFNEIWKHQRKIKDDSKQKIILVALPIATKESIEIIKLIHGVVFSKNLEAKFHFKPHPALDLHLIKKACKITWKDNFHFIDGDFTERLVESDVLLGNTSSTCMESIALGIPAIIIGSQSNLTQNPIPTSVDNKIWRLAYTSHDLSIHIQHYLDLNKDQIKELILIGSEIRKAFFEPVTKNSVQAFLGIC